MLEHGHVTNGRSGDRVLDVCFSHFCSQSFQGHIIIKATRNAPIFWSSNLYGWFRTSERNGVWYLCCQCLFNNIWPFWYYS